MPHLILEYSSNIFEKANLSSLLKKMNEYLSEILPTDLSSCKSRSIEYSDFFVGNGNPHNAFLHVNLKVLSGRSAEQLHDVGQGLISILKEYFQHSATELNLQITLEIEELQKTYFKYVS